MAIAELKSILFRIIIFTLKIFVKKDNNLIVYMPLHDPKKFTGNLKAQYLYGIKHEPTYNHVYISRDINVYNFLNKNKYPVVMGTISTLMLLAKTKCVIIDATTSYLTHPSYKIIQLWHGSGIKNVGLLNDNTKGYFLNAFKKHYQQYYIVASTSKYDAAKHNDSFNISTAAVTGIPRNDIFFSGKSYQRELKEKYNLAKYDKIISYAPTFRDAFNKQPLDSTGWEELNNFLSKSNAVFVVNKHPFDKDFIVPDNLSNILDLTQVMQDVQELLIITDILISDYSSIVTDFAITRRPTIYYLYDHQEYITTNRSTYKPIEEILPGPFIFQQNQLLQHLQNLDWFEDVAYQKRYQQFLDIFHQYFDGDAAKRIFQKVKE